MSELTVTSTPLMGPLSVSVLPEDGDPIEFALSSGATEKTLPLGPGRYTVVARRPNGTRLYRTTVVESRNATVALSDAVGSTPNEFMQPEFLRGEVASASERPRLGIPLAGAAADVLDQALLRWNHLEPRALDGTVEASAGEPIASARKVFLRAWHHDGWEWVALENRRWWAYANLSGDFFKMTPGGMPFAPDRPDRALCVGLMDEDGLGPVVSVPRFVEPVELTFVLQGVRARVADRDLTGQQRVPAALVGAGSPAVADLLSALASPYTPSAAIWDQVAPGLGPGVGPEVGQALETLAALGRHAEALLVAHYVLRFLPGRLDPRSAELLAERVPSASDGPTIAAWAWIRNRPAASGDAEVDEAVARNVSLALARPVVLFARTRTLLFEARRLAPPDGDAPWRRLAAFRRAGAGAGGLECFWGRGPDLPVFGLDESAGVERASPPPSLER